MNSKRDSAMETADQIQAAFDKTFAGTMARLTGKSHGIEDVSFNLSNISCLILLQERQNEMAQRSDEISAPYDVETLEMELAEMGYRGNDPNRPLRHLFKKGFIGIDEQNKQVFAKEPAKKLIHLMDRVFPRMKGLNLLGYLIQTMDEVRSGRKGLDIAVQQFDQTLSIHGVSLIGEEKPPSPEKERKVPVRCGASKTSAYMTETGLLTDENRHSARVHRRPGSGRLSEAKGNQSLQSGTWSKKYKGSDIRVQKVQFGRAAITEDRLKTRLPVDPDPVPLKNQEEVKEKNGSFPIEAIDFETEKHENASIEKNLKHPHPQSPSTETANRGRSLIMADQKRVEREPARRVDNETVLNRKTLDNGTPAEKNDAETASDQAVPTAGKVESVENPKPFHKGLDDGGDEALVEKRIALFEEILDSECPVCKNGKVEVEKTATGKTYYKCNNRTCSFISWGKPHHIICPECRNTFLIETLSRHGKPVLKCPRATCRYRRSLDSASDEKVLENPQSYESKKIKEAMRLVKPRRKVVRKRRVRKKR